MSGSYRRNSSKNNSKKLTLGQRIKKWFTDLPSRFAESLKNGTMLRKTWRFFRPIIIAVVSLVIVASIFIGAFTFANKLLFAPVEPGNNEPVMLVVGNGSSMATVANKLQEMGLINSKWGIKLLADFTNRSGKVKAGEYILNKNMSVNEILDLITQPSPVRHTARVTVKEGMNVEEIAQILVEKSIIDDKNSFIAACNDLTKYEDISFINEIKDREGVRYALEGFLFPDTYDFYLDSQPEEVIRRMLVRFTQIYEPFAEKAKQSGMTINEVISLASIVQSEGLEKDFAGVSAVFRNRLAIDMTLSTDVCIQYAINEKKLILSTEELNVDSPYNLHKNKGLTPGPICSPGQKAIAAALNPDEKITTGKYYYFTLTDPATGELAFSKTYEEHKAVVDKWRPVWEEYDKNH